MRRLQIHTNKGIGGWGGGGAEAIYDEVAIILLILFLPYNVSAIQHFIAKFLISLFEAAESDLNPEFRIK